MTKPFVNFELIPSSSVSISVNENFIHTFESADLIALALFFGRGNEREYRCGCGDGACSR
jgi:hypothetical protein